MAKKPVSPLEKLDLMQIATTVKPGGTVPEADDPRELKRFMFILKGKRTLVLEAYSEEEAQEMFNQDEIFGKEKVIDIIEDETDLNASTSEYNITTERSHVKKVVKENNPFELAKAVAEERKTMTITRMVMNPDGTSSAVEETVEVKAAPKKRASKKK